MNLAQFIKALYEDTELQERARQETNKLFSGFLHVSEINERYCPMAWVYAEQIKAILD